MLRRTRCRTNAPTPSVEWCMSKLNPGISRSHTILFDHGKGSYIWDVSGKKYLDFSCGIGVTNLGHAHPRLIGAATAQLGKVWHAQMAFGVHAAMADLLQQMERILPAELESLMFVTTGAEAVEAAVKLARQATKRSTVVVLQGSFHGRTALTAAMTTSKAGYTTGIRPQVAGIAIAPFPYASQMHDQPGTPTADLVAKAVAQLDDVLHQQVSPSDVAMIIAEPVLGEGGYVPMPASYAAALREVCTRHGILLCIDEVQSGFGRTGSFFHFQQLGIMPDIVTFAKGVANGLPLAGLATRKVFASACVPGTQGGTYGGNAVSCATAAEVIRTMQSENIFENVNARGAQLLLGIQTMVTRLRLPVQEVRGRGLMIGVQLDRSLPSGLAAKIVAEAGHHGLILMTAGIYESLRLIPPLIVTEQEVQSGLGKLEEAMLKVLGGHARETAPVFRPCCDSPCLTPLPGGGQNFCCRYIAQ